VIGIVGSGIFINPYVVALRVHTPFLILGVWLLGGGLALLGAFIWAELASRLPGAGGQYLYLREAYHPSVAFIYGWVLLLVTQTGGMAAVAVTFGRYYREITGFSVSYGPIAAATLLGLTAINCCGVRAGSNVQSVLMMLKAAAIAALVVVGILWGGGTVHALPLLDRPISSGLGSAIGAAMIPVAFAYGGWQTANFVARELKNPERDLPRGLLLGVAGVVIMYSAVNYVCLRTLGPSGLAATTTPASAVMQAAFGDLGGKLIALAIAISALGFLSQSVLTAPRVYFAMAEDGAFFRRVAWVHPRTQVPVFAILLQSLWTLVIVLSGTFEQILSYVVAMDWIFFGLSASCLFVFRKRSSASPSMTVPGHPFTTLLFCLVCFFIVLNTIYRYPVNTLIGIGILLSGIPVYYLWKRPRPA